jgi:hypothetical protein
MYLFMCTGLQLEFYITRCWCHLRVKRTGATSREGTTHPSRALDPPPPGFEWGSVYVLQMLLLNHIATLSQPSSCTLSFFNLEHSLF